MNQKDLPFYISFLHNTFKQVLYFNPLSTIVMILIKLWSSKPPPPMCIYSQANFQVNTEVTAEWERAIQGVCVTATPGLLETLVCSMERVPHTVCS